MHRMTRGIRIVYECRRILPFALQQDHMKSPFYNRVSISSNRRHLLLLAGRTQTRDQNWIYLTYSDRLSMS